MKRARNIEQRLDPPMFAKCDRSLLLLIALIATPLLSTAKAHAQGNESQSGKSEDINVRYAQKRVELAKAHLQIAQSQNKRLPNENSQLVLMHLQHQVDQAELMLQQAENRDGTDVHVLHIEGLKGSPRSGKTTIRMGNRNKQKDARFVSPR